MGSSKSYKGGVKGKGNTVPSDGSKMGSGESHSAKGRSANPGTNPIGKKKGMKY